MSAGMSRLSCEKHLRGDGAVLLCRLWFFGVG
jgi:hypothetical protein